MKLFAAMGYLFCTCVIKKVLAGWTVNQLVRGPVIPLPYHCSGQTGSTSQFIHLGQNPVHDITGFTHYQIVADFSG